VVNVLGLVTSRMFLLVVIRRTPIGGACAEVGSARGTSKGPP